MFSALRERLHRKKLAYQRTFLNGEGSLHLEAVRVMADLKRFCGISRGGIVVSPVTRTVDPYATAYRAGQRDTYLRIAKFLGLDETDIEEEVNDQETPASDG